MKGKFVPVFTRGEDLKVILNQIQKEGGEYQLTDSKLYVKCRGVNAQKYVMKEQGFRHVTNLPKHKKAIIMLEVARLKNAGLKTQVTDDAYNIEGELLHNWNSIFASETEKYLSLMDKLVAEEERLAELGYIYSGVTYPNGINHVRSFLYERDIGFAIMHSQKMYGIASGRKRILIQMSRWNKIVGPYDPERKIPAISYYV